MQFHISVGMSQGIIPSVDEGLRGESEQLRSSSGESRSKWGPSMGGPQCRMSILRNSNVACLCRLFFFTMSHVEFKKCRMSLYF